jgi:hypothetical protein
MHSQARLLSSLFRTVSFAVIAALVMMLAMVPAGAQNSVPPTAVQAARMPEFASRLAHPVKRPSPPISPALARAKMHRGPLDSNDIYDNGPTNGNTDAWTINFGFITSDSFNVANNNTSVTGMSFAAWLTPGDVLGSAEVSITSSENGGTSYFDQIVNFTQSGCIGNDFGYNVCTETASFNGPTLNSGTYWLNLQNASVPNGDPVYWDENSGPSQASENTVGTIPSESFTILGSSSSTTTTSSGNYSCPRPQNGFHDLRDFNAPGDSGVAIDSDGNLYGALGGGGYGPGVIYELAQRAGRWLFTSLYGFRGGSNGNVQGGVIVGPEGVLYGAADGGIPNCGTNGTSYCGLIYKMTPGPAACPTALCSWNETPIYQFTSGTDAWGGSPSAFDSAGNLYGISQPGGAYGAGAVFELTPSQGGWTETIIYSFTGENDGGYPTSLLVGHDGNLYGTADDGGYGFGLVFQLVSSGGGWTENVLYSFTGASDGEVPGGLNQDRFGNLWGFSWCQNWETWPPQCGGYYGEVYGLIFSLQPSASGWEFNVAFTSSGLCDGYMNVFNALTVDAAGNLYAAEGGDDYYYSMHCGNILDVTTRTTLVGGNANIFGNITSDAKGKLYGTTGTCGFGTPQRTDGMIWQYSP